MGSPLRAVRTIDRDGCVRASAAVIWPLSISSRTRLSSWVSWRSTPSRNRSSRGRSASRAGSAREVCDLRSQFVWRLPGCVEIRVSLAPRRGVGSALEHLFPGRLSDESQTSVTTSEPASVLIGVRTGKDDPAQISSGRSGRSPPCFTGRLAVINRVDHHGSSKRQIGLRRCPHGLVGGDPGDPPSLQSRSEHGLLDRINREVHRSKPLGDQCRHRALTDARQP